MENLRFKRVMENMKRHGIDELLVTSTANIFYLTGKWIEPGERMMVLYISADGEAKLFLNELFPINSDLGIELSVYNDSEDSVRLLADTISKEKLGIDKNWPSHFLIRLMNYKCGLELVNGSPVVDEIRMVKDSKEIDLMRKASQANDKVMEELIELIPKGYEEKKVCKLLADIYEKHGADSFSFYPLIAYGGNAAEPHHSSDSSTLKLGDSVILDIGGRSDNYCSDMTRTVFYGEPEEEYKRVYNIVLEANLKGIEAVKPGVRLSDIDKAARDVIEKAGFGKYFTHRTGHNIGIDEHEAPDVGAMSEAVAEEGMIFSIEPGIYLPERCGVRIEDLVLVTKDGCEILNKYTKDLQVVK
jgi:Xaa-Pro dipeptidase